MLHIRYAVRAHTHTHTLNIDSSKVQTAPLIRWEEGEGGSTTNNCSMGGSFPPFEQKPYHENVLHVECMRLSG